MEGVVYILPELALVAGAVVVLLTGAGSEGRTGAGLASLLAFAAAGWAAWAGAGGELFGGAVLLDRTAVFARVAVAVLLGLWLAWVAGRGLARERAAEAAAFAMLSAAGGMLIASANDLIVLFISLELSTMPAYVMIGYRRADAGGLEGALKYFLLSMLTSIVMLYGLSFIYGLAGSTAYPELAAAGGGVLRTLGFTFALVGLLAKLSAAPFHYWTPDAYAGSGADAVAFVSTVPKVAGTVALVRLFGVLAPGVPGAGSVLLVAAVVSMLLGNLAAFPQTDLRRLMAYSGVAHTGYVLLALASGEAGGAPAVFYAVAYAGPSMAVMLLAAEEGTSLVDLGGLVGRRPAMAWSAVVWLLSLVGIPPMVGFFGKLYLFTAAVSGGLVWAVAIAVAMSVVSAGYYFRVLREAFFGTAVERESGRSGLAAVAFAIITLAVLLLGVFAAPALRFLGISF